MYALGYSWDGVFDLAEALLFRCFRFGKSYSSWTAYACAAEPAVAHGVFAQVLLMIFFGIVKWLRRLYFRGDGAIPRRG